MTKWEKFAKEKGIKKTKKERMVYDDTEGDFRPRFGYKRVKGGIEDQPIVEVKAGQDPYADPWSAGREEKKKRVNKNLENKLKNELRRNPKKSKQLLQYGTIIKSTQLSPILNMLNVALSASSYVFWSARPN